jgi:hypothetical protein
VSARGRSAATDAGNDRFDLVDFAGLEQQGLAAIVAGDPGRLDRLHSPDFLLCNPSGRIWDRSTYLNGLISGRIDYHRFEPTTPIEVLSGAEVVALRYKSWIDIAIDHGPIGHLECWHLDVYSHDPQLGWRCRWSQATDSVIDQTPPTR